ncbi:MAG: cyclic nucleotide-binding domain-containing protein [Deltaproteobacteria bacterium]|nr:cyclic nucleotide-binding domain-containing protein [Deltaproteobacteria bacterium]
MNKTEVLQASRLFEGLIPDEIEMLCEITQKKAFKAGEVVFEQGDVGDSLYILVDGSVDVVRKRDDGSEHVIATLEAPDFFGEMSLIDKEYRSASIRARADISMLCLTNENLHSFARVYKNGFTLVVINIARVLSTRLRETNEKLAAKM